MSDKITNTKVLILEDDLETVESIFSVLKAVEKEKNVSFCTTVIPDHIQVQEFINKSPQIRFDILLLDRDCFLGGSFHNIDLTNFDLEKVISISSVPKNNEDAQKMGINKIILKDFSNLKEFSTKLIIEINNILSTSY